MRLVLSDVVASKMNFHILASGLRRQVAPKARTLWTSTSLCRASRTAVRPSMAALAAPTTVRFLATKVKAEKPYYVSTPIFYVNAEPHIGHLYTMVLSDILKRWRVLRGQPAYLSTGTDEHGLKIQQAAYADGSPPKEFCDKVSEKFRTLARRANLSEDRFIRTTDADHKEAVQYFWTLLQDRGYIYEAKHEGWYCVSDETYYPESQIEKRLDPVTGRTFMASQETGKEVEWTSEANYHFKLSAFRGKLLEYYKEHPDFIIPNSRMQEVTSWLEAGLEDLSISRPITRLQWGIPVPDDFSQTIYVWLDALVNYATVAGFPNQSFHDGTGGWPADVHVIGKDIMRFHCIYWPAFLLALDLPLPRQILTHAHWTMDGGKMSKSVGNVVSPGFAMDKFGTDTMRFYLCHDGGIKDDADYSNEYINERYRKCLAGGIGNLVQRITKPKAWNVRSAVKAEGGRVEYSGSRAHQDMLRSARELVDEQFRELNPRKALLEIMEIIYATNRFIQEQEPWAKIKDTTNPDRIAVTESIIFDCAEAVRIAGILLLPYMPSKAAEILDMLGVSPKRRTFGDATYGVDHSYGESTWKTTERGEYGTLFPPLVGEMTAPFRGKFNPVKGKVARKEQKRAEKEFAQQVRSEVDQEGEKKVHQRHLGELRRRKGVDDDIWEGSNVIDRGDGKGA